MSIPWVQAKQKLTILWFTGAGVIFFILLLQTILGRYEENANKVWNWFLPNMMPVLSLIISVLVMDVLGKSAQIKSVERFIFRISFFLSLIYIITIASIILLKPFSPLSSLELMEQSNLWLGPMQGLVSASLGAFFIQSTRA